MLFIPLFGLPLLIWIPIKKTTNGKTPSCTKLRCKKNIFTSLVGVSLDPEGSIEDADLSIYLNEREDPQTITIQKLGPAFLPELLCKLWRDRKAFTIIEDTLSYYENGEPIAEKELLLTGVS